MRVVGRCARYGSSRVELRVTRRHRAGLVVARHRGEKSLEPSKTEPVRRTGDSVRLAGADQGELCENLRRLDHDAPIRSVSTELDAPIGAELMTVLAGMTTWF